EIDGLRGRGDETDQSLAFPHARVVHRAPVQALRREEFENLARTAQVDGTHLRDHVDRDHGHELVEARLCAGLLRHDLAQAAKQEAWSLRGDCGHLARYLMPYRARTPNAARAPQA